MVNLYLICLYTFTVYLLKLKVLFLEFILYEFTYICICKLKFITESLNVRAQLNTIVVLKLFNNFQNSFHKNNVVLKIMIR